MGLSRNIKEFIFNRYRKKYPNEFYGQFTAGCLSSVEMFIWNMLEYSRFYEYCKYKYFKQKNRIKEDSGCILNKKERENYINEMRDNGVIILDGFFEKQVDLIKNKYKDFYGDAFSNKGYKRKLDPDIDDFILDLILHPDVLYILSGYYNAQPYLRCAPGLNITYPNGEDITSRGLYNRTEKRNSGFADFWHLDTMHLTQMHILLNEVDETNPHMLYAIKSHKRTYPFKSAASEEFIQKNFKIKSCVGKKGTIYIFDGSRGFHRLKVNKETLRTSMNVHYTLGNSILGKTLVNTNKSNLSISRLMPFQKECLEYLLRYLAD